MSNPKIQNWHERHATRLTQGQRIADKVAAVVGSWKFIIIQSLIVFIWLILNIFAFVEGWDPYPFILLNLLFSLQAAYTAPIIMMAQNRQNERDRLHAAEDFHTNVRAKEEIEEIQTALSRIENEKLENILKKLDEIKK
jgi:uncharacterized membrane protein